MVCVYIPLVIITREQKCESLVQFSLVHSTVENREREREREREVNKFTQGVDRGTHNHMLCLFLKTINK